MYMECPTQLNTSSIPKTDTLPQPHVRNRHLAFAEIGFFDCR